MKCSECPNIDRCIEKVQTRRDEATKAVAAADPDPKISAALDLARAWASEFLECHTTFKFNITMMELDRVFKMIGEQNYLKHQAALRENVLYPGPRQGKSQALESQAKAKGLTMWRRPDPRQGKGTSKVTDSREEL